MNSYQSKIKSDMTKAEPPNLEFVKGLAPYNYREFKKEELPYGFWVEDYTVKGKRLKREDK